jgi:hypothetical protein
MKRPPRQRRCTGVIADMVGSRLHTPARRQQLQRQLAELLTTWNRRYKASLLSRFTITTGDEFQGLLHQPQCLPELIRSLETAVPGAEFRIGAGFGELYTELTPTAIGMDGPVWHNARAAIVQAKEEQRLGGVFNGFGADDPALNALARFLEYHFRHMTKQQRAVADLLLQDWSGREVADRLGIPASNVSRQKKAIAWTMLREGDQALATLMQRYDTSAEWSP